MMKVVVYSIIVQRKNVMEQLRVNFVVRCFGFKFIFIIQQLFNINLCV